MEGGRQWIHPLTYRIWRRRNIFTADRPLSLSSFMAVNRSGKQSKSLSISLSLSFEITILSHLGAVIRQISSPPQPQLLFLSATYLAIIKGIWFINRPLQESIVISLRSCCSSPPNAKFGRTFFGPPTRLSPARANDRGRWAGISGTKSKKKKDVICVSIYLRRAFYIGMAAKGVFVLKLPILQILMKNASLPNFTQWDASMFSITNTGFFLPVKLIFEFTVGKMLQNDMKDILTLI